MMIPNFNKETISLQPWSHAYKIAGELTHLGCNVTLFTDRHSNVFPASSSIGKIPFQILPVPSLRFLNEKSLEIIKQKKPDVVYWFGNSLSGIYVKRIKCLRIPLVLHISAVHYSLSDIRSLSLVDALSHWVHMVTSIPPGSFLVRLLNDDVVTIITVPSRISKDRLSELGVSKEKIKVAPLVFDARDLVFGNSKTMLDARAYLGLEQESFIATYFGSPNTVRGTDILIRSAKMLKSKLKNLRVVILSRRDPEKKSKHEKLLLQLVKKYELVNVVKVVPGILSREIVESYLTASNVIVLPFRITQSEPPLTILEAMAMGKPVVTTKTCGLPEIVDFDRGFLVRPGNANDLAEALYYLAQNPEIAAKLGRGAREFVSSLSDWKELGKWTKQVLYQVVKNKG